MLYLWRQLVKIARKHLNEVLSDPETAEHPEELSQLLHLVRPLQNIELIDILFQDCVFSLLKFDTFVARVVLFYLIFYI